MLLASLLSRVVAAVARGYCRRPWLLLSRVVAAVARGHCYHMMLLSSPVVAGMAYCCCDRSLLLRWPVVPALLVVSSIVCYCWHCSLSLASFVVLLVRHIVAAIVRG